MEKKTVSRKLPHKKKYVIAKGCTYFTIQGRRKEGAEVMLSDAEAKKLGSRVELVE